jgi:hypothetical protein
MLADQSHLFMLNQLELFAGAPVCFCTQTQGQIMKKLEDGNTAGAEVLYQVELLRALREANGNLDDARVKQVADFGRRVFGTGVDRIFAECSDILAGEVLSGAV